MLYIFFVDVQRCAQCIQCAYSLAPSFSNMTNTNNKILGLVILYC